MMRHETMRNALERALEELNNAETRFRIYVIDTDIQVPLPRPPKVRKWIKIVRVPVSLPRKCEVFAVSLVVPNKDDLSLVYLKSAVHKIILETGGRPHLVYQAIEEIQWATQWLLARFEGYQRAQNELLRQQNKWVEQIEAELTIHQLKEVQL